MITIYNYNDDADNDIICDGSVDDGDDHHGES